MKFVIVAVLLAAVVGTYGASVNIGANAGANAAIGGGKNAAAAADAAKLNEVLTRILGPRLAATVSNLISLLAKNPLLRLVIHSIPKLLIILLKSGGVVEKLVSGGDTNAPNKPTKANGKPANLTPQDQATLETVLERTVGPFTAPYVVRIIALLADGKVLGELPLDEILKTVIGLVQRLAKPGELVGKLIGQKGLGKPISKVLGAGKSLLDI